MNSVRTRQFLDQPALHRQHQRRRSLGRRSERHRRPGRRHPPASRAGGRDPRRDPRPRYRHQGPHIRDVRSQQTVGRTRPPWCRHTPADVRRFLQYAEMASRRTQPRRVAALTKLGQSSPRLPLPLPFADRISRASRNRHPGSRDRHPVRWVLSCWRVCWPRRTRLPGRATVTPARATTANKISNGTCWAPRRRTPRSASRRPSSRASGLDTVQGSLRYATVNPRKESLLLRRAAV